MTWQTLTRSTLLMASSLALGACSTLNFQPADPEKYMGLDCEQLDQLSESYRGMPQDLLNQTDPSELERRNETRQIEIARGNPRPYEIEQHRDQRSIALARREKGCL